jgi:hypothetical protein
MVVSFAIGRVRSECLRWQGETELRPHAAVKSMPADVLWTALLFEAAGAFSELCVKKDCTTACGPFSRPLH